MKQHFSLKTLAFYAAAIGSVIILFTITTSYGKTYLKAPQSIGGRYAIAAQALPGCLKAEQLILEVKQSGIYLTGNLLAATNNEAPAPDLEQQPALSGEWNNEKLWLTGPLPGLQGCQGKVTIAGSLDAESLNGTMNLESMAEQVTFTAQREKPTLSPQTTH